MQIAHSCSNSIAFVFFCRAALYKDYYGFKFAHVRKWTTSKIGYLFIALLQTYP